MKKITMMMLAVAFIASTAITAWAQADYEGFGLFAGAKYFGVKKKTFGHSTNPGDAGFLSGPAGNTSFGSGASYAAIGLNYEMAMSAKSPWSWKNELGCLIGIGNEDRRQNANDNRSAGSGSFIYSDSNWGISASSSLNYHFGEHFYLGGCVEYDGLFIDNGWERFGKRQSEKTSLDSVFGVGPVLGWNAGHDWVFEAKVLFGNGVIGSANVTWRFW